MTSDREMTQDDYTYPTNSDEIRQGDIFKWCSPAPNQPPFGFVLTADCDFAQQKTRGQIAYLPIIQATSYLSLEWAPTQIRKRRSRLLDEVTSIVQKSEVLKSREIVLSSELLLDWLGRDSPQSIAERLLLLKKPITNRFLNLLAAISLDCSEEHQASLGFLTRLTEIAYNEATDKAKVRIAGEVKSFLSKLPDDAFFLNMLPERGETGYVILLRHVRTLSEHELLRAQQDEYLFGGDGRALRIGRLSDRLRFAVAQAFGQLFTRIGLPAKYENSTQTLVDQISLGAVND